MEMKSVAIHIDSVRLCKIRYIAEFEERSLNRHVLILIRKNIQEFERKFGKIELETAETENSNINRHSDRSEPASGVE